MPNKPARFDPNPPQPKNLRRFGDRAFNPRGTSGQRGYDYRWQQLRATFLHEHPLCIRCLDNGETEPATEVDHIQPMSRGGARLDPDNLQPLCRKCHSAKTWRDRHR